MSSGAGFAFGPFQLDVRSRQLLRAGALVPLSPRQFDLLVALVSRPGELLSKDTLIQAAWPDVAVTDNSLAQAIGVLRLALDPDHPRQYIETLARRGYRFTAPVTRVAALRTEADLEALLAPHRALFDGTAALETLERSAIARGRSMFEQLLVHHPDEAAAHVGLANACLLQFEMTRTDPSPDTESLRLAVLHAHEACRLDPTHAEALVTLGLVLERTGDRLSALAALRRGTQLEPDNWRHQLRLALTSWGEERLRAARQTLALMPDAPLARLLAATVFVARGMLTQAERELDAGLAALPRELGAPKRFAPVALHWLKGLLCLARGADDEAMAAFERELAVEAGGQLYAREYCANTWYAIGAWHWQRGDRDAARAAFEQAIVRVPLHAMAHAGLAVGMGGAASVAVLSSVDMALARAAVLVAAGDAPKAARTVGVALAAAPAGNAGWLLPIEPLVDVKRDRAAWAEVLAQVRSRAM